MVAGVLCRECSETPFALLVASEQYPEQRNQRRLVKVDMLCGLTCPVKVCSVSRVTRKIFRRERLDKLIVALSIYVLPPALLIRPKVDPPMSANVRTLLSTIP